MFLIIILPPFFIFCIVVVIILLLRNSKVMANAQASGLIRDAKHKADASVHAKRNLADELFKGAGGLLTRVQAEAQAGFIPVIQPVLHHAVADDRCPRCVFHRIAMEQIQT
jgi:hypothetical protein